MSVYIKIKKLRNNQSCNKIFTQSTIKNETIKNIHFNVYEVLYNN